MRDYGSVSPQFWIGKTGKALRGKPEAQLLALYLMTCPHANMIGVFHCPVMYMAHETGLGFEGASKALASLVDIGFCLYDEDSETVFVIRMAAHQVGENLKADDNKVKGVQKEVGKIAVDALRLAFIDEYAEAFHIKREAPSKPLQGTEEAPSKQLTGTGQEQDKTSPSANASPSPSAPEGFETFWAEWPSGGRKGGKADCLKVWRKDKLESQAATIIAHVKAMKASREWLKDGGEYIPAPLVYLRGKRWDGAEIAGSSGMAPERAAMFQGAI